MLRKVHLLHTKTIQTPIDTPKQLQIYLHLLSGYGFLS
jgi:hypothetical protein